MLKKWLPVLFVLVLMFSLVGCAQPAAPAPAAEAPAAEAPAAEAPAAEAPAAEAPAAEAPASGGDVAFKVTGMVNAEQGLTDAQLKAMETTTADSTGKDGSTTTYTGVAVAKLLEAAGVKEGAANVAFVADDGYSAELPLADVLACANCIVGFRDDGKYQLVMPGFPGNAQVKGVVEINVK